MEKKKPPSRRREHTFDRKDGSPKWGENPFNTRWSWCGMPDDHVCTYEGKPMPHRTVTVEQED